MSSSKCSAILNRLKYTIVVQKYSREVQTNSQNQYGEVAVNSRNYSGVVSLGPVLTTMEQFAHQVVKSSSLDLSSTM